MLRMCLLKRFVVIAGFFFFVGPLLAEEANTVEWFKANAEVRKTTLAKCRNNPGELGRSPSCINASRAASEITWSAKGAGVKVAAAFLAIVARVNPVALVLECVTPYQQSASAWVIRHQLRDLGYTLQEAVFSGEEWGTLEHRERYCLVAVTRGLSFDLASVKPGLRPVPSLGAILEPVPTDSPSYREVGYLKAKEAKDKAAGKGFAVPYLTPESTHVPTLRKGYHKGGSCDARVLHPTNPALSRLLTATEHARAKGIDERLIAGLSQTTAHELLGQSILFAPFRALAAALATALRAFAAPLAALPAVA